MKAAIYGRKTLPDLLLSAAEKFPEKGIGFVQSDGSFSFVAYPELLVRARTITAGLQESGLKAGDEVMIIMTRNEGIIPMVWACFLGGFIPTILQPPVSFTEFNQPAQKIDNVFRILKNPRVILSEDLAGSFHSTVIPQQTIIPAGSLERTAREAILARPDSKDLAYIQFSSGSTGDPKGVMLTHENILTNLAAICVGLDISDSDVFTDWMPLYHDMGLFGYHLCPLFGNCDQYLIDPIDFVKRPTIWLDAMEKARTTITGCPNFGQALLLRYLKNRDVNTWDLSSVKAIVNGAEPISNRIMSGFLDKLAAYGLRKGSMMPAYGMAEATLAISFHELMTEPVVNSFDRTLLQKEGKAIIEKEHSSNMMELVSVGKALNDNEIRLVDEAGGILGDRIEGHIQIRGAGVTSGYYNNPTETRNAFADGWLKTGDKGFFYNGNLYITGRVKDIIFVRGQNLYAHDLENLAGKNSDISFGKVIIGGLFDSGKGQDLIILFLVGSPNQATCETCLNLRSFFRDTLGITIDIFVPLRSNQIPKTSSGKIQRYKLISNYQNGEFHDAIAELSKLIHLKEKTRAQDNNHRDYE